MAELLHALCHAFFTPPGCFILLVYVVALTVAMLSTGQRMQLECVLRLLGDLDVETTGMTGLDLVKASHKCLKRDSVYVILNLLEEKDFVRSERLDTSSMRCRYFITDKGKNYYMSLIGA